MALEDATLSLSYRQLADTVARCAAALQARGIAPGMIIGLEGPRDARFAIWMHALAWLGAAVAPIDTSLKPTARKRMLEVLKPCAIVDADDALPAAGAPRLAERFWPLSETRLIVCTSGTTGAAKAVPLSTAQLLFSAFGSAIALEHRRDDRWLCCLPLHHIGGLSVLWRAALYQITARVATFDASRVSAALDSDITMVSLVPAMLRKVLDVRDDAPFASHVRTLLVGGAATGDELRARCRAIDAPLSLTWGMTEAASQIATTAAGQHHAGQHHAGDRLPPLAFARVEQTSCGRLRVRGPLVGGELVTTDAGSVDEAGVSIAGRADDVIISGGENIAPSEIEALLRDHPSIEDAAVVGVPSPEWGARPWAAVVARDRVAVDDDELLSWCRARVAAFKTPDRLLWCDALPRTALGKVSKRAVYEMFERQGRSDDRR